MLAPGRIAGPRRRRRAGRPHVCAPGRIGGAAGATGGLQFAANRATIRAVGNHPYDQVPAHNPERNVALSGKQKRFLRGLGHKLKPVVTVGKQGLGPAVVSQVEANLLAHELIKIRLLESCPLDRDECAEVIRQSTGAELAQSLGRTQLYYRAHPEQPGLLLPAGD